MKIFFKVIKSKLIFVYFNILETILNLIHCNILVKDIENTHYIFGCQITFLILIQAIE